MRSQLGREANLLHHCMAVFENQTVHEVRIKSGCIRYQPSQTLASGQVERVNPVDQTPNSSFHCSADMGLSVTSEDDPRSAATPTFRGVACLGCVDLQRSWQFEISDELLDIGL